jgi:hypothetical protein
MAMTNLHLQIDNMHCGSHIRHVAQTRNESAAA